MNFNLAEAGTEFSARRSTAALLLILLAVGTCSTLLAISRPLWFDEIFTVLLARLPSGRAVREALNNGADANPPLFYYAARLTRQFIPDDHLGYRLPSVLGLLGTVLSLFLILRRRVDGISALVGAVFVLCTPVALYGHEARPYALMLACISAAILAWQHVDDSRRLPAVALAVALASAVSLHYYASLVLPAFVLAEASVWVFHRRFRPVVWAALLAGTLPLIVFARTLARLSRYYGPNFWEHAHVGQIFAAHNWLFNLGGYWGWVLTIGITLTFLSWNRSKESRLGFSAQGNANESPFSIEEGMLTVVFLWLPIISVVGSKLGPGAMTVRYMLPTVLGGALAVGYLTSKVPDRAKMLLLVMMLLNYGVSSMRELTQVLDGSALTETLLNARTSMASKFDELDAQNPEHDPIVISSGLHYMPLAYYTPCDKSRNLYTLTDPEAAVEFAKTDSVDLDLLALRKYVPLQIQDYREFALKHPEFLLVSNGDAFDWWPARLAHDGHTLTLVSKAGNDRIYKVSLSPDRLREWEARELPPDLWLDP